MVASLVVVPAALPPPARAQVVPTPAQVLESWPRKFTSTEGNVLFYQPQLDAWDGARLEAHAAVAIERKDTSLPPVYGVIWIVCRTEVDRETRRVTFLDLIIEKASFPSEPASAGRYLEAMRKLIPARTRTIALDRLESAMAEKAAGRAASGRALKNEPPRIIFAETPTLHIPVDGKQVLRPTHSGGLDRVINTRQLILFDPAQSRYYLRLYDGWMTSVLIEGPWDVAADPPSTLDKAMEVVTAKTNVDLLDGMNPEDAASGKKVELPKLDKKSAPAVLVSTSPTEVIVTEGPPNYVPIDGTQLLYVANTTSNVFKSLADQNMYVLLSGRWYTAAAAAGPWTHVPAKQLPPDFAAIPDESPKENVKAAVPGTP
jgi:hypothetical protein